MTVQSSATATQLASHEDHARGLRPIRSVNAIASFYSETNTQA